ncbi:MAG TPA: sugar phosphate isomerase/epimerase family protein [Pirellulales bacterium]|nr:sugar phosphate isomerase/epimerase family protein [Pirellulales bacterium]
MLTLRIAIRLAAFQQPLKKSLQFASELGFEAVELDLRNQLPVRELSQTGLRQFRKLLDDLNLRVCAVSFPTRRGYDDLEDLDRRVSATKEAMSTAYQLGAPVLINQIGMVPPKPDDAMSEDERRRWQTLVEVLTELGLHGQRCGTRLAASTGTEPGENLNALLSSIPEALVVVNFDPGNLIMNGYSAVDSLRVLGPLIAHFHVRDAARDLARGRGLEVEVGRGSADFPELLAGLEECDYRGYLTIAGTESADPLAAVSQATEYLRNL